MTYARPYGLQDVNQQFNIMGIVGNGFDIQVMKEYDQSPTTQYSSFYHYMKMRNMNDGNLVLQQMERSLGSRATDWSDVEACIDALARQQVDPADIRASLDEIRDHFSDYLNTCATPSLLARLSSDAAKRKWSITSLSKFLGDLERKEDLEKIPFGMLKSYYDYYNFHFVNFNYTSIFDNYIFLDAHQFDPLQHKTVDRNFNFHSDPRGFAGSDWNYESSSYLEIQVSHPHGYQDIPRSLLFGLDLDGDPRGKNAKLSKPYWARLDQRYKPYINDTDLFVIFGCSLGATDAWWWRNIAESLEQDSSKALIIYWWNSPSGAPTPRRDIVSRFLDSAGVSHAVRSRLEKQIAIVSYKDSSERLWLSTSRD